MVISCSELVTVRNIPDKFVEKIKTHILCSTTSFQNRDVYEIMCRIRVEPYRTQIRIWHMRISCCIRKSTNTHSEYVIRIALLLQQWLHESASVLRYTYVVCLLSIWIE